MKNEPSYGRHAAPDGRPPWLTHPKKHRMPKLFRKILVALIVIAILILGYYIYLILNPTDKLVAHRI